MEDQSLFNNSQPQTISEGLQNFINAMVEEIVLEGKPFDTQKKYLKKFSENEGVDYETLESKLIDFFDAIKELEEYESKSVGRYLSYLAQECYLSDTLLGKLVDNAAKVRTSGDPLPVGQKVSNAIVQEVDKKPMLGIKNGEVYAKDTFTIQGDLEIPSVIDGQKVTAIGESAFCDCTKLVSVMIPEGIDTIGQYAFLNCSQLVSVSVPNSVVSFARNTFRGCNQLQQVTIGHENYRRIKDYLPANVNCIFIDSEVEAAKPIGSFADTITDNNSQEKAENSFGTRDYPDGKRYEGQWKDGFRHGQGTCYYANGNKYEGNWVNDRANGFGKLYYSNGLRYEGNWECGMRSGYGIIYDADGNEIFEGEWKNDKRNGLSTLYMEGGFIIGNYVDDKQEGEFTLTTSSGEILTSTYRNGMKLTDWH